MFVLTYRVGEIGILPKPLEDLAAALRFIGRHSKEFSLNPDNYAVGGFSAGGNLITMWGTENAGYKAYGLPRPTALFPVYPVVDIKALEEHEKDREFIKIMLGEDYTQEALGTAAVLEEGEHAPHGFGDGTGTDVEGWPERAADFLENVHGARV